MMNRIEPQRGTAFELPAGATLRVVDPLGEQVSDLFAFSTSDSREYLSSGRSLDYAGKLWLTTGDVLYSNRSAPMLTIVEDAVGRHDFTLTPCSQETFDLLYDANDGHDPSTHHPSCFENLAKGFAGYGIDADRIGVTFNIFMDVSYSNIGEMVIGPPLSRAGDHILLRAERDLLAGLTACSAEKSNNGTLKPIDYEITR